MNFWSCKKKVPELLYLRSDRSSNENRRAGVKDQFYQGGMETILSEPLRGSNTKEFQCLENVGAQRKGGASNNNKNYLPSILTSIISFDSQHYM